MKRGRHEKGTDLFVKQAKWLSTSYHQLQDVVWGVASNVEQAATDPRPSDPARDGWNSLPLRTTTTGKTILHQLVQKQVETFLAQVETETGAGLSDFIKDEFDDFFECSVLAHSFLRLRCSDCAHEELVDFSCKRRGFYPSCGARRIAQTAAHLVEHVILPVSVRQWVLSFPIPVRYLRSSHPIRFRRVSPQPTLLLGHNSAKMPQCVQIMAKLRISNTLKSYFSINHHQN